MIGDELKKSNTCDYSLMKETFWPSSHLYTALRKNSPHTETMSRGYVFYSMLKILMKILYRTILVKLAKKSISTIRQAQARMHFFFQMSILASAIIQHPAAYLQLATFAPGVARGFH